MIDNSIEQRTLDWHRARLGNITGSRVSELIKSGRSKGSTFSETGKSYLLQLAAERMMNPIIVEDDDYFAEYVDEQSVTTKAMRIGSKREEDAKKAFEREAGLTVEEVSSCRHDTIAHFAASPDGIIYRDMRPVACIEIKSPRQEAFMRYAALVKDAETLKAVKPEYYWQTQAEMECTGTTRCYFIAFNPWQRPSLHVAEILKSEDDCALLRERVQLANEEIDNLIKTMKNGSTATALQSIRRAMHATAPY